MVIIFAVIFLLCVTWIARVRWRFTRTATLSMFLYFLLTATIIDLFFQITFSHLLQKFLFFAALSIIPVVIIRICGELRWRPLLLSLCVSFVLLLPFTRSSQANNWTLTLFPVRFLEDVSRMKPDPIETQMMSEYCQKLSPAGRSILTGRLWRFDIPQSSNSCLEAARIWNGPEPVISAKIFREFSIDEWRQLFRRSPMNLRLRLFEELRVQQNSALVQEAVDSLDINNEILIVAAVKYLRRISGKPFGYEKEAWKEWADSPVAGMKINLETNPAARSQLLQRGFSAVDVQNDFFIAKERKLDFLGLYIQEHFPKTITADDLALIRTKLNELSPELTTRLGYRKGILLFLLALSETKLFIDSGTGDPASINVIWTECIQALEESRELGSALAEELKKVLRETDSNQNGSLEKTELTKILNRTIAGRGGS